jgi:hypothetical protein
VYKLTRIASHFIYLQYLLAKLTGTHFNPFYHFFIVFLGDRISECVMCAAGVDLAYRPYFRILSELLLSSAVEVSVRERLRCD